MDKKKWIALFKGLITFIPFVSYFLKKKREKTKHSNSNPKFCFTLWSNLINFLKHHNVSVNQYDIAELGSNCVLGVGICSILSGAKSYTALEIQNNFNLKHNLDLLDEIVDILKNNNPILRSDEFPQLNLTNNILPDTTFTEYKLSFNFNLVEQLKEELSNISKQRQSLNKLLFIDFSWQNKTEQGKHKFDFLFSRAVLEHTSNPQKVFKDLKSVMKNNGIMVHDIEYHSHNISKYWNKHFFLNPIMWKMIFGKRDYFLNRNTHSDYEQFCKQNGFEILNSIRIYRHNLITKQAINNIQKVDLTTFGGILLAKKIT